MVFGFVHSSPGIVRQPPLLIRERNIQYLFCPCGSLDLASREEERKTII